MNMMEAIDAAIGEKDRLRAENKRLKNALRDIANRGVPVQREEHRIARAALNSEENDEISGPGGGGGKGEWEPVWTNAEIKRLREVLAMAGTADEDLICDNGYSLAYVVTAALAPEDKL